MGELPFQEPWFSAQFVCKIWSWKHWRNRMFGRVPSPKTSIPVLANVLQLPMNIRCPQKTICDRIEGFCLLLRRFSYPCRYSDTISRFGRPVPELCMIANEVMNNIFNNHGHRISQLNDDVLSPYLLQEYADVIRGVARIFQRGGHTLSKLGLFNYRQVSSWHFRHLL